MIKSSTYHVSNSCHCIQTCIGHQSYDYSKRTIDFQTSHWIRQKYGRVYRTRSTKHCRSAGDDNVAYNTGSDVWSLHTEYKCNSQFTWHISLCKRFVLTESVYYCDPRNHLEQIFDNCHCILFSFQCVM